MPLWGWPMTGDVTPKERLAERLEEAGLATERFINVKDGGKASTDHTQYPPDRVNGNYGVYAGRGLVQIDIDDYDADHDLEAIESLPDTLTTRTAHDGDHRLYHVPDAPEVFDDTFGVKNPNPEWGEVRAHNQYTVGPGSQLDGCGKDWCDECEEPDGGRYTIHHDRPIAQINAHVLVGALRGTGYDVSTTDDGEETPNSGQSVTTEPEPVSLEDSDLIEKAKNAKHGDKFRRLWNGDTSMHDNDHSRADLALCKRLAFWTGGEERRIDSLFRQSGLMREKWERDDYRQGTIDTAVRNQTEFYDPDSAQSPSVGDDKGSQTGSDERLLEAISAEWFDVSEKLVRVHGTTDYSSDELAELFSQPDNLTTEQILALYEIDGGEEFLQDNGEGWRVEQTEPDAWSEVRMLFASDHGDAPAITRATQLLLDEYDIATNSQTGQMYVYQNGAYHPNTNNSRVGGEPLIRQYLNDAYTGVLDAQGTRRRTENILKKTKDSTPVPVDELGGPSGKVCLQDGVLDLSDPEAMEFVDHSPEYLFTSQLNAEYDPEATCPRFKQFIGETVRGEDIQKLQEYCGYLLMHWDQRFKKALMLLGPNDSGKSTLSDTLAYILGEENVSGESMHDLAENRFSPANLVDRLANINAELDSDGISSIGTFKKLTGNERVVRAERKNKDAFQFRVTAKMVFAANRVPDVKDADDAFYERMLLVSMPNTFSRSERDPELRGKLRSEASGILNWMIEGYSRLVAQGRFSTERDLDSKRDFWEAYGDPVERFKQNCLTVTGDGNDMELQSELYDRFKEYCQVKGLAFDGKKNLFTRKLTVGKISKGRRTGDEWNGQQYVYTGAELDGDAYKEAVLDKEAVGDVIDKASEDGTRNSSLADHAGDADDTNDTDHDSEENDSGSEPTTDGGVSTVGGSAGGDSDPNPEGGSGEDTAVERQKDDIDDTEDTDDKAGHSWARLAADIRTHYSAGEEIDPERLAERVDRDTPLPDKYFEKGLEALAGADVIERKDGVFVA